MVPKSYFNVYWWFFTTTTLHKKPKITANIKPAFFVTPTIKTLFYCKFSQTD